jgi:hypothetical protein
MYSDGSSFTDHPIHQILKKKGLHRDGEWFSCTVDDVKAAWITVKIEKKTLNPEPLILKCVRNK